MIETFRAHQGADVGGAAAVAAQDLHRLPLARQGRHHLGHPVVEAAGVGVDIGEQLHLGLEIDLVQQVVVHVEVAIGARRRRRQGAAVAGAHRRYRIGGAADGILVQLGRMGVTGRLVGDGSEAEALSGVEAGALQTPVVEGQALGLAVFKVELPVVGAGKGIADDALDAPPVEAGTGEEQVVRRRQIAHGLILLKVSLHNMGGASVLARHGPRTGLSGSRQSP